VRQRDAEHPWAVAADHQARGLRRRREHDGVVGLAVGPLERHALTGEQPPDDREGLLEARHPVVERNAVGAELVLVPARAEAEHEAPAAHLGERGRHPRDQARRMESRACHQRTELHALCRGGERGEQRPRIPGAALASVIVAVEQMIAEPDRVEPDLLRGASHREVLGPADLPLDLRELDPDSH
jgi:hypothetical protein